MEQNKVEFLKVLQEESWLKAEWLIVELKKQKIQAKVKQKVCYLKIIKTLLLEAT